MKRRMLDTDTLSYILKQREPVVSSARNYVMEHGGLVISIISFYEVLRGLTHAQATRQIRVFEAFAATNEILPLSQKACRRAADIYAHMRRSGRLIEDADLLIASIALANDCILVTNNTSHYQKVPDLELENWAV